MTERQEWINEGKRLGMGYLVVVADTFSYENYPVYAKTENDKNEAVARHNDYNRMSRVMEVVKL
jgi:hypothetical protein